MQAPALVTAGLSSDPRVLLIEVDAPTIQACVDGLKQAGMQVAWVRTGAAGTTLRAQLLPDVVLVGLRLPDVNSVDLVRQFVEPRNCAVIVLSDAQDETARTASLEAGADDYLAKPSSVQDMIARVRAVHYRVNVRKGCFPATRPKAMLAALLHRSAG